MKKILILSLFIANISHATSVQEATSQNFEEIVLKAKNPVVVDFFATWCQPCKTLKPTFHELAECYGNAYTFVEVDIDKAPQIAKSCGINQVPTFAVFNKGSMCAKFVGGLQKETFEQEVTKALTHNPEKGPLAQGPQVPQQMLMLQAINTHDITTLKKLINDGLDINEVFTFPITFGAEIGKEIQITYLSLALSHHDKEVAAMLLNAGANPNTLIKNTEGNLVTAREQLFSLKEKTICNIDATIAFLDDYLQKKSN